MVCQDIFLTEIGAIADVVLLGVQWGEKTGCFTNVGRTVHISHKAVKPLGETKFDLEIFLDYGKRMGFKGKNSKQLLLRQLRKTSLSRGRSPKVDHVTTAQCCTRSSLQNLVSNSRAQKRILLANSVSTTMQSSSPIEYCERFRHGLENRNHLFQGRVQEDKSYMRS
jgi:anaerobic selenocysteine-containing dehydrogenase